MATALLALSIALAIAWVPILLRFVSSWRARRNPVSLAICGIIVLSVHANVIVMAVYAFNGSPQWAALTVHIFNALVCLNFYLSFMWARKRFPDARS